MEARSCTSSTSSSCSLYGRKGPEGHHKAIEFACSAGLFCVYCPLSIVWCCIKIPCKIGCKAAGQAKKRFSTCCGPCGSEKKIYASYYSSFSDIEDFDSLPSRVGKIHGKVSSGSPTSCRMPHKNEADESKSTRSVTKS